MRSARSTLAATHEKKARGPRILGAVPRRVAKVGGISAYLVSRIVDAASSRGVDAVGLCECTGLTLAELADPEGRVDAERYQHVWVESTARVGDRAFPIYVATLGSETTEPANLLRLICMGSATIGEALERASRYLGLATDLSTWILEVEPTAATVTIERRSAWAPAWAFADEFAAAEIVNLVRVFSGKQWAPREVTFVHEAPADVAPYERFFASRVRFSSARTAIYFDPDILRAPLVRADPAMVAFFTDFAEKLLVSLHAASASSVLLRVRELLAKQMHDDPPSMDHIASQLGVSTRTLRRQLQAEKTTFKKLLDETRLAMARRYLEIGDKSSDQIAFLLGFSDVTAFHRAFRRWTGMTPQAYRRTASGPP